MKTVKTTHIRLVDGFRHAGLVLCPQTPCHHPATEPPWSPGDHSFTVGLRWPLLKRKAHAPGRRAQEQGPSLGRGGLDPVLGSPGKGGVLWGCQGTQASPQEPGLEAGREGEQAARRSPPAALWDGRAGTVPRRWAARVAGLGGRPGGRALPPEGPRLVGSSDRGSSTWNSGEKSPGPPSCVSLSSTPRPVPSRPAEGTVPFWDSGSSDGKPRPSPSGRSSEVKKQVPHYAGPGRGQSPLTHCHRHRAFCCEALAIILWASVFSSRGPLSPLDSPRGADPVYCASSQGQVSPQIPAPLWGRDPAAAGRGVALFPEAWCTKSSGR